MVLVLAILIGALYAGGIYLVLRRNFVKLLIGLALLGHAANLLIFTSAGLTEGTTRTRPPLLENSVPGRKPSSASPIDSSSNPSNEEELALESSVPMADPLPQALVLTAIVISFAVLAFSTVLLLRAYQVVGTDDIDRLRSTDR